MAVEPGDVIAAARRVLTAVEAAALSAGVTLPTRAYVATGGVVYDCEMVSVSMINLNTGFANAAGAEPMVSMDNCGPTWQIVCEVAIVRCAQEKMWGPRLENPPKIEWIEGDLTTASADAAILAEAAAQLTGVGVPSVMINFFQTEGAMRAVTGTITAPLWT